MELRASIKKFNQIDNIKTICRFPARYKLLDDKSLIKNKVSLEKNCSELMKFKDQLNAKSISIIFSSYYINTPASAFGHTFLRFNRSSASSDGHELLDRAINFSATVTTRNALLYAAGGLFGYFNGEFSVLPYFYKLREYNDYESRDIYSYELNLSEDQIDFLINHLWEMKQTIIKYYYLTENCSYYMLAILDAVNPNWKLLKRNRFYTIPGDTVKVLKNTPGLINKVTYRASNRKKLEYRYDKLNKKSKKAFWDLNFLNKLNEREKADVLDSKIEYFDLKNSYGVLTGEEKTLNNKRNLLILRSKIELEARKINFSNDQKEAPHKAHGSMKLGLNYSYDKVLKNGLGFNLRFALHDKNDPPSGYSKFMEIDFFNLRASLFEDDESWNLFFNEFNIVRVASHSPWKKLFNDFSWEFLVGLSSMEEYGFLNHAGAIIDLSLGYYFNPNNTFHYAFFFKNNLEESSVFDKNYLYKIGGEFQFYLFKNNWNWINKLSAQSIVKNKRDKLFLKTESQLNYFFNKNSSVYLNYKWIDNKSFKFNQNAFKIGYNLYF